MKAPDRPFSTPAWSRLFVDPRRWIWGAIIVSILVCALISWLHFQERRAIQEATRKLESIRRARIELGKGFLHFSLAGDPGSPFRREEGLALLQQAISSFASALARLGDDEGGYLEASFRQSVEAFQERLTQWDRMADAERAKAVELQIDFHSLEREIERVDAQVSRSLQEVRSRLDVRFIEALVMAVLLLAAICGVIFLAVQATTRSEQALRRSEAWFKGLVAAVPDALLLVDAAGRILLTNREAEKLFGYLEDELLNEPVEKLIPPRYEDHAVLRETYMADAKVRVIGRKKDLYGLRKDGSEVPVELAVGPAQTDSGMAVILVVRDLTERVHAKKGLIQAKESLERAEELANLGSWELDVRTGSGRWSKQMFRMFELSPADGVPSFADYLDLIHPEDRHMLHEALTDMSEGREPVRQVFRTNPERLPLRYFSPTWRCTRDEAGKPVRFEGTLLDTTEQAKTAFALAESAATRQLLEAERLAREAADQANRAKSAFLASMSHEIRTPMNAILGFAQLLARDPLLTPRQRKDVQTITRSGEHLLALINDILEMSKIEAGRATLNPTTFCLHDLLAELEAMFRLRADAKGLELVVEREEGVARCIIADEGKLRQVFINLLGNAVKFTERGRVALRVRAEEGRGPGTVLLLAEVDDSGPGISQEDQQRLFRPFEQAASGGKAGGTGLGLAISREFVRMMGGEIRLSSEVGRGSCFRFEVEVQPAEAGAVQKKAVPRRVAGLQSGTRPVRVLVVDDNADDRTLLGALLKPVGFQVQEAADGVEALEAFHRWLPHVVLMDIVMPVMDGYEATRRLKATEAGRAASIVAVTASAISDAQQRVKEEGADAYMCKPFREEEIFETLGRLLGLRYIYAEEEAPPAGAEPQQEAARSEAVAALPRELREAMRESLEEGDMGRLRELTLRVQEADSAVARELRALADRYDYEKLGELLGKGEP